MIQRRFSQILNLSTILLFRMSMESTTNNYTASSIQVLKGLEAVRKRPGMYIGSTGIDGLHHLVYEVVDNSIDEALAGYCSHIVVALERQDIVRVEDDGRGIPVDTHPTEGISALELVMTRLHAGGKFDKKNYKVSGGLHGVGVSVVNALSVWLEVYVHNEGKVYYQKYRRGIPEKPVALIGETDRRGTVVRFQADPEIFEETVYSFDVLSNRLRELAFLNKGVKISLIDERLTQPKRIEFKFEGGLREFVEYLNKNKSVIHKDVIYFSGVRDEVEIEIGIQYNDGYNETMFSFVNGINTREGGTHLIGFRNGLTKVINDFFKKSKYNKKLEENLSGDDVREGLTAVLSIKVMEPQFEGQTKGKLGNSEVKGIVETFLSDQIDLYFQKNPNIINIILENVRPRHVRVSRLARRGSSRAEKIFLRLRVCPASSPIVRRRTHPSANCLSSRGTRPVVQPRWAAIECIRRSSLSGAKCSMWKKPASIK